MQTKFYFGAEINTNIFLVVGQIRNRVEHYQFNGVPFVTFDSGNPEILRVKVASFM